MIIKFVNAIRGWLDRRSLKPGEKIGARLRIPDPPPPKKRPPDHWQPPPDGTEIKEFIAVDHGDGRVRVTTGQVITTPDGDRFLGRVYIEDGTEY